MIIICSLLNHSVRECFPFLVSFLSSFHQYALLLFHCFCPFLSNTFLLYNFPFRGGNPSGHHSIKTNSVSSVWPFLYAILRSDKISLAVIPKTHIHTEVVGIRTESTRGWYNVMRNSWKKSKGKEKKIIRNHELAWRVWQYRGGSTQKNAGIHESWNSWKATTKRKRIACATHPRKREQVVVLKLQQIQLVMRIIFLIIGMVKHWEKFLAGDS